MNDNRRDLIIKYYKAILNFAGKKINEDVLVECIRQLSDEDIEKLHKKMALKIGTYLPMLATATVFPIALPVIASTTILSLATEAETLVKQVEKYNYSREVTVEINGNRFRYQNSFPIDDYRDQLFEIGNDIQGETFAVSIDEGELVVY